MARQLVDHTVLFDSVPNQVIVNEYLPGQGIAMHVDRLLVDGASAVVGSR